MGDEWRESFSMWDAAGQAECGVLMFGGVEHCAGVASVKQSYVMFGLQREPHHPLLQTTVKRPCPLSHSYESNRHVS